jgi:hypothetical protein
MIMAAQHWRCGRAWRRTCFSGWRSGVLAGAPFGIEEDRMLFAIAAVIFVLWLLGWLAFHIAGGFIHLVLVVALIVLVIGLITGRASA